MRVACNRVRRGLKAPLKVTQERIEQMEEIGFQFSKYKQVSTRTGPYKKDLLKTSVYPSSFAGRLEERLCNDVGNEILIGSLPNPSETARFEIITTETQASQAIGECQ